MDAEAELKRRRERGKQAQSAFRKRQAVAKKSMEVENTALKNAIAALLAEVDPDTDRPELQARIRQAAEVAGLDVNAVPRRRRMISPESPPVSTVAAASTFTPTPASATTSSTTSPLSPPRKRRPMPTVRQVSDILSASADNMVTIYRDPFHCHRCTAGAAAVLPFLGAGAFTFAGLIFWHLVEKYESTAYLPEARDPHRLAGMCGSEYPGQQTPDPLLALLQDDDGGQQLPRFTDLVSQAYSTSEPDVETWLDMVEARMRYYRSRSVMYPVQSETPNSVVTQDAAREWLSPDAAEVRIRSIVGDEVFAVLARPAIDRFERRKRGRPPPPPMEENNTVLVEELLDKLSESFVCMGSGPRWHTREFDDMFLEWCSPITGRLVEPV